MSTAAYSSPARNTSSTSSSPFHHAAARTTTSSSSSGSPWKNPLLRIRVQQEVEDRRRRESTYTTPLSRTSDMKEFLQTFYRSVYTPTRQEYYKQQRQTYPMVDLYYQQLCCGASASTTASTTAAAATVSFEDFWQRYDYRCGDLDRIANEIEAQDAAKRQKVASSLQGVWNAVVTHSAPIRPKTSTSNNHTNSTSNTSTTAAPFDEVDTPQKSTTTAAVAAAADTSVRNNNDKIDDYDPAAQIRALEMARLQVQAERKRTAQIRLEQAVLEEEREQQQQQQQHEAGSKALLDANAEEEEQDQQQHLQGSTESSATSSGSMEEQEDGEATTDFVTVQEVVATTTETQHDKENQELPVPPLLLVGGAPSEKESTGSKKRVKKWKDRLEQKRSQRQGDNDDTHDDDDGDDDFGGGGGGGGDDDHDNANRGDELLLNVEQESSSNKTELAEVVDETYEKTSGSSTKKSGKGKTTKRVQKWKDRLASKRADRNGSSIIAITEEEKEIVGSNTPVLNDEDESATIIKNAEDSASSLMSLDVTTPAAIPSVLETEDAVVDDSANDGPPASGLMLFEAGKRTEEAVADVSLPSRTIEDDQQDAITLESPTDEYEDPHVTDSDADAPPLEEEESDKIAVETSPTRKSPGNRPSTTSSNAPEANSLESPPPHDARPFDESPFQPRIMTESNAWKRAEEEQDFLTNQLPAKYSLETAGVDAAGDLSSEELEPWDEESPPSGMVDLSISSDETTEGEEALNPASPEQSLTTPHSADEEEKNEMDDELHEENPRQVFASKVEPEEESSIRDFPAAEPAPVISTPPLVDEETEAGAEETSRSGSSVDQQSREEVEVGERAASWGCVDVKMTMALGTEPPRLSPYVDDNEGSKEKCECSACSIM